MTTAKFIVKGRKALQLQQACANPRECARVKRTGGEAHGYIIPAMS